MTPTISVTGLSRRYRGQAALDDVRSRSSRAP